MPVTTSEYHVMPVSVNTTDEPAINRHVPHYLLYSNRVKGSFGARVFFRIAYAVLYPLAFLILRPRRGPVGNLEQPEVNRVYSKEARKYNYKHHLTTRGMDLVWRNWTAQSVCNIALNTPGKRLQLLDLCTGTGLTIKSIVECLREWKATVDITGLDYNDEMLAIAKSSLPNSSKISLVKGDATRLTGAPIQDQQVFAPGSFDIVTQMFGIGGIDRPLENIREVLKVLRTGGVYLMVDMHQPVYSQPGEFFLFGRFFSLPYFEQQAYEKLVLPVALKRLWGWRDTTWLFYLSALVTVPDAEGTGYYGFAREHFEFENQRWIFSLPLMPVAKIKLRKESISREEALRRQAILEKIQSTLQFQPA